MSAVSSLVLRVCILSVLIGLVSALRPASKLSPQLKLFTSSLLIIAILSPLSDALSSFHEFSPSSASFTPPDSMNSAVSDEVLRLAQSDLENSIRQMLAENAVPCSSVSVSMNINSDGCINIESVKIIGTRPQDAYRLVSDTLGKDVPVYAEESF